MAKKKAVKIENFYPLVAYLKRYLQKEKPGRDATRIEKDRHALAVKCVRKMDLLLEKNNVVIGKVMMFPGQRCPAGRLLYDPIITRLLKK
ncbi:MAG: hypothetical protein ACYDH3_11755 [Candidatus Aminicenantales bacterium]